MKILHLDASPRANRSRSREVAQRYLSSLPGNPTIEHWALWDMQLPSLGEGMIEARYDLIRGQAVPAELAQDWSAIREMCDDFLWFDHFVISTPMWNFGIPYRLKHFVDVVTQPGMTFTNDSDGNVVGLAQGKSAVLFAASAMPFGKDEQLAPLEFQTSYLEAWLNFIGIEKVDRINISPTFGAPEDVEKEMQDATAKAAALASGLKAG